MLINWIRRSLAYHIGKAEGRKEGESIGWYKGYTFANKMSNRRGPGKAAK